MDLDWDSTITEDTRQSRTRLDTYWLSSVSELIVLRLRPWDNVQNLWEDTLGSDIFAVTTTYLIDLVNVYGYSFPNKRLLW